MVKYYKIWLNSLTAFGCLDFPFRKRRQMINVSLLSRFQWKRLLEKLLFGHFFVSAYLLYYTNRAFMFLIQQSHVQWRLLWNLLCNANKIGFTWKNPKNKILSHLARYLSYLFRAPENFQTTMIVTSWVIGCHESDSKQPTGNFLDST